jgi:ArsC family.
MIKIYYKTNCNSSQKAMSWLDKHELEIEKLSINQLEKKTLKTLKKYFPLLKKEY